MTIYRAHIDGHNATFEDLASLRVWANDLIARHSMSGVSLKIYKGRNESDCHVFESCAPAKVITI